MISRKKLDEKMTKWTKAVVSAAALARKLERIPKEETESQTIKRLSLWEAAEAALKKAQAHESVEVGLVYDLFRKTLEEDPELQWDRIVDDMHTKDPWEDLRGAKHNGLRVKSVASFWECIDFHKLTVYSVDAAERQSCFVPDMRRMKREEIKHLETVVIGKLFNLSVATCVLTNHSPTFENVVGTTSNVDGGHP